VAMGTSARCPRVAARTIILPHSMPPDPDHADVVRRAALVRRGLWLNNVSLAYMTFEAGASLLVGLLAGSLVLVGFGLDSVIELAASVTARWRLRADYERERRMRAEKMARRIIGWSFLVLAAYIATESVRSLLHHAEARGSWAGIAVLALSAILMPILARQKRKVARGLDSRALKAEAMQTSLCAWLSVIALAGVALNTTLGWWWADPVAALAMVPIIAKEGVEGIMPRK
jgi:divalent metal cation (Fe/Co/Zn/Cd) transporter